jgi:SAM-dependent methyltransferase
VNLLPDHLSENNAREASYFDNAGRAEIDYMRNKPAMYPRKIKEHYEKGCAEIGAAAKGLARKLGHEPSVLFAFAGGGMEVHLSGLLGNNVVVTDISMALLKMAQDRFAYHKAPDAGSYVACDAERLPFKTGSFDLVVAFEGIHHCLIPQAALQEVWRVAKHRTYVSDNYESGLTRLMSKIGRSSVVEYTGTKPNRFTRTCLETMLYNASISDYSFKGLTALPPSVSNRLGYWPSKYTEWLLTKLGQHNQFTLITDRKPHFRTST